MKSIYYKYLLGIIVKELRAFYSYYNQNTETALIWFTLFGINATLFYYAVTSSLLVAVGLFLAMIVLSCLTVILTLMYLYRTIHDDPQSIIPRIHKILNKSFKARDLIFFISRYSSYLLNTQKFSRA